MAYRPPVDYGMGVIRQRTNGSPLFLAFSIAEDSGLCQSFSPRLFEHGQAPAGVGRARRGHGVKGDVGAPHQSLVVAPEGLGRLAAVEADGPDGRVRLQ